MEKVPAIPRWFAARDKKIPGFRYSASNTNHKWGELPLYQLYDVDQITMSVVSDMEYTWADNVRVTKHILQPRSGLHKRVASIQVLH